MSAREASLGKREPALVRPAVWILVPAIAIVGSAITLAQLVEDTGQKRLFDNVHWTVSYGAAAALAWLGERTAGPDERLPRRWFAWALTLYFAGQVLWDGQVALGWNPFPGPSDLCFICLGPLTAIGLVTTLQRHASRSERRRVALDVAGLSVAVLALTLALYLPRRGHHELIQMVFLVAYPVVLSGAACIALILAIALHIEPARGWLLFMAALVTNGVLWLRWNSLTLDNALADGTTFNALFSVTALVQGTGALLWRADISCSRRWEKWCDALLRLLPLFIVVVGAAAVVLAYTMEAVPAAVKWSALAGSLVVVLVATVRQSILLSEREELLLAVRESESKYRVLMDQAPDGIFIADPQGRYVDVNARGAEMLRMGRNELIGKTIRDIVAPEEVPRIRSELEELHSGGRPKGEWQLARGDGTRFWAEVSGIQLPDGRLQGIVRDITERKEAEEQRRELEAQLRESQKMEAVGTLAAGIAHDFNNLIASIRGNADLAAEDLPADHRARESIEEIGTAGARAAALVGQIVAFSSRRPPHPEVVSLRKTVDEVSHLLRSTLPAGVELHIAIAGDAPSVLADETQLHQVIVNLCTNAWQAMGGTPGTITIRAEPCELNASSSIDLPPGQYAHLSVEDTGAGMGEDVRARIFEPFFSTKAVGQGTGLGLSVVHGIVSRHGGAITVESTVGLGTTFHVYLPATAPDAPRKKSVRPATVRTSAGKSVLYIDDEAPLVFLVTRQLQRRGCKVRGTTSADEGLAMFRDNPSAIDLVITDYNMPRMSGVRLAAALLAIRPGVPILITSGYVTDEMSAAAERVGVKALIYKPGTIEELCDAIDRVLAGL